MRDPAIHIRKSDLQKILAKAGLPDSETLADRLWLLSVPYHIKDRYLVRGNADTVRKVKRAVESSSLDNYTPEQFNGLLSSVRNIAKHQFIQNINKGSSDWAMLKEIQDIAGQFVKTFDINPIEEGYKIFIEIGLKLMGRKYALNRFKFLATKIHAAYESYVILKGDVSPDKTKLFWEMWKTVMLARAGKVFDITAPELYIHMVFGKQEADENEAVYLNWIEAQFEGLAFLNAIPEPSQFYGDNAKLRYQKHMIKQGVVKQPTKEEIKIKEEDTAVGEATKDYFALLRAKHAG